MEKKKFGLDSVLLGLISFVATDMWVEIVL